MKRNVIVIGSGFGGLGAAARLLADGHDVTIFEARDKLGGRAYTYEQDGFRFDGGPTILTAPWMFDEIRALKPFRGAVHQLARRPLASPFYDARQLAANRVPVAALIYFDDMYVDAELSLATAEAIPRLRYWITNEYEHDGLRQDPGVFRRLKAMLDD